MKLEIDSARLTRELETLASFSDAPAPAVTRILFTETDLRARDWIKRLCVDAGLVVREDAVGNMFARWIGSDPELPAVGTGSHIDAIPHSGRYDGTAGVLGSLEAIRALQRSGFEPARSIELLMFTAEEPTRFGIGCLGSRLLSNSLTVPSAVRLRDSAGMSLEEVRQKAGFGGALEEVPIGANVYAAFVELHIEQGPLLERRNIPIGVVKAIAAPASLWIEIEGGGGHAGAVLMPDRRDAFVAAAEIVLSLEAAALSTGAIDSVATAGVCDVFPGAINSIPSRVRLAADVRDIDEVRRNGILTKLEQACRDIAVRRGVSVNIETINRDSPAVCDPAIVTALSDSCRDNELDFDLMVSRAYHDTLFMARICPAAMIFIPCRNGVSHTPEEYASPESIANGTRVLAGCVARLAKT